MKILLVIFLLGAGLMSANAQEREGVKKEGAHQAEYNSDAQDRDHSAETDSRVQPSEEGEEPVTDAGEQTQEASSAANTAGTDTRTVSSAGSPGILMSDDSNPDGTNTMQRASMNIAGSPIPGGVDQGQASSGDDRSDSRVFEGKEQKDVSATVNEKKPAQKASSKSGKK